MILREEDVGGRERVTTDEERVAQGGCICTVLFYSANKISSWSSSSSMLRQTLVLFVKTNSNSLRNSAANNAIGLAVNISRGQYLKSWFG